MGIILAALPFALIVWLKKSLKNKKTGVLLSILLGAFTCVSFSYPHASLPSIQEQVELQSFFRLLIQKSEFGYTLFGEKPMSFYSYFTKLPSESLFFANLSDPKIEKHFLTYDKYKKCFCFKNYIILDQVCTSKKFPTSGIVRDVLIINKQAFKNTVTDMLPLFQERLGQLACAEDLLEDIESGKNVLFDVLKEDELLWGILLGYGPHNAEIYARREAIMGKKADAPSQGYDTFEEELEALDNLLVGFTHEYFVDKVPLPMFLCDANHIETQMLKKKYRQIQKGLCKIYNSPDFLDQVLRQLRA